MPDRAYRIGKAEKRAVDAVRAGGAIAFIRYGDLIAILVDQDRFWLLTGNTYRDFNNVAADRMLRRLCKSLIGICPDQGKCDPE